MSLILEALRKSEAERRRGQAPGLFVEQVRVPVRRRAGTPAWAWGLMLLLVGVLVAWGWREFGARAPASVDTPAGGSMSDGSDASRAIATTTVSAPGDSQRTEGADASDRPTEAVTGTGGSARDAAPDVAAAERRRGFDTDPTQGASTLATPSARDDASLARGAQIAATAPQDAPGTAPAAIGPASGAPDTVPANAGDAQNTLVAPPAASTTPGSELAASAQGRPPAPAPASEDESLPRLSELTGDERSGLPALKLSMHVYAEDPAQRFVIVDGRRLREGDSPAAGIAVEAIRRDGLVLSVNGRRVLLARP